MSMKVVNEMALSASKPITVMLLEPYAGKLARTVLRGESSRKGADLLDNIIETGRICSVIRSSGLGHHLSHFGISHQFTTHGVGQLHRFIQSDR